MYWPYGEEDMEKKEYSRIAKREDFYFWHVGRREILKEALERSLPEDRRNLEILDIGCGPGGNITMLSDFGRVTGLDNAQEALAFAKTRGFERLLEADATKIPLPSTSFDLISSLDMLEHISDDEKVISEAFRLLKQGGTFLVTAPAHPWLWSSHDEALHHVRRYTRGEITSKLKKAGFLVVEQSHFVMAAVPMNLLRKLYDKIFSGGKKTIDTYDVEFSPAVNALLLFILRCEKKLMRSISLPFGSSLLVVAKKP